MPIEVLLLLIGLLVLGCIASSKLSSRFSMPSLLLFLLIGCGVNYLFSLVGDTSDSVIAGPIGGALTWQTCNHVGTIALSYILFAGGYDSSWGEFRRVLRSGGILSTLGVLATTVLLGGFAYIMACIAGQGRMLMGSSWQTLMVCMLIGAVISSTDASAVFSILRSKRISLKGRLRPLLELESGSNDPMAAFLTIFFLDLSLKSDGVVGSLFLAVPWFMWQLCGGVALGVAVGYFGVWLFDHMELEYDGLYYVMGMAVVVLAYAVAALIGANGFMAVYVAGMWMGNHSFVFRNSFLRFSDAIAWLMQVLLFTILGFKANLELLWALKWQGLGMALFLMLVARPAAAWLSLSRQGFGWREKTLVSWVGLRGGAPIMLATFPLLEPMLASQQVVVNGVAASIPEVLFNLVFFMVLLSVAGQSFTIMPLASWLKLDSPLRIAPTPPISFDRVTGGRVSTEKDDMNCQAPREFTIPEKSDWVGKDLRSLGLPAGAFVIMIRRGRRYVVPRGHTILKADDVMTILGTPESLRETDIHWRSAAGVAAANDSR